MAAALLIESLNAEPIPESKPDWMSDEQWALAQRLHEVNERIARGELG